MQNNDMSDLRQGNGFNGIISRLMIVFVCFAVMIILSSIVAVIVSSNFEVGSRWYYLSQNTCQNIIGFIGAAVASAYLISRKPWQFLGVSDKTNVKPFVGVVIVYLLSIPAMEQLVWYNEHAVLPDCFSRISNWMREMEDASAALTEIILNDNTVWGLISGILIIGILTGLSEELLFRGALQKTLSTYQPIRHLSIWITAFIFSAVHLQFFGFFPRFVMGMFLGYLLFSTGSIWPGVFAHALNNSMVVWMSWMESRGTDITQIFHNFGVKESGLPVIPVISTVLLILFFTFYYKKFFNKG